MGPRTEQLIRDYLNQLSVAAYGCLKGEDRRALVARIRERIDTHLLSAADTSPHAVRQFLEGIGDPAAIVDDEVERAARPAAAGRRPRALPDWPKGLRTTLLPRPRKTAGAPAIEEPVPVVESGPAAAFATAGAAAAARDEVGEDTATAVVSSAAGSADAGTNGSLPPGDEGPGLVTSRPAAAAGGALVGRDDASHDQAADVNAGGAEVAGPVAASDLAAQVAAAGAIADADPDTEDAGIGLVIGRPAAAAPDGTLIVERPYGTPRRSATQRRRIARRAPPTGAAKAAEVAASAAAVGLPPPPAPPVAAWRVASKTAREHPLEAVALVVLGLGGVIYPPVWLLGAALSVPAKAWDYRDKWTGLAGPVLLLAVAFGFYLAFGRGSASLGQFMHHSWLFVDYFSRVVAVLGTGYLGWRLVHGHPRWTVPPWNRMTKPG